MDFDIVKMRGELKADEGVRCQPYKDQYGNWTIGVGHLLVNPPAPGAIWSLDTVYSILDEDILIAYNNIKDHDFYKTLDTDSRRRALINMSFNLGHKLLEFHQFLGYLEKQQWGLAAQDLIGTLWHKQLPARSNRIIGVIRNG